MHGAGYWIRPLLIELAAGAGFAWLYHWEIVAAGLLPPGALLPDDPAGLHAVFAAHILLISLMTIATFVDFDEKTIPDWVTVPGTLLGLALMACWPAAALPVANARAAGTLLLTSPHPWAEWLDGPRGLAIGLACLIGWGLAIWPKTVTLRRGLVRGVRYLVVSMFRSPHWRLLASILVAACGLIALVWLAGDASWRSLLTALVGMAAGGGLVWAVRIVGQAALGKEAMGFGDVTLMAMIGVYVGWQSSLIVFFMAPFVAVVMCVAQWLLTRRRDIAFGPFLCGAALLLIVFWSRIWAQHARPVFQLGWLIPQVVMICLVLMAGMLGLWRIVEHGIFGPRS